MSEQADRAGGDENGPCFYCGKPTVRWAGDPGLWPLYFCQPDGTGITRVHHTRCVTSRLAAPPSGNAGEGAVAQTIPNTDPARQFPLYELMPDFTLYDRDPQADERLKLYRDIFAEITAKAIPVCDPNSDDPGRVRHYILPVGPLHRAAGKLGFQLFDGERHLADAIKEIARLNAAPPQPAPDAVREAMQEADLCFDNGLAEGWIDALENGDIERIRDIWHRRMSYGLSAVRSYLVDTASSAPVPSGEEPK